MDARRIKHSLFMLHVDHVREELLRVEEALAEARGPPELPGPPDGSPE